MSDKYLFEQKKIDALISLYKKGLVNDALKEAKILSETYPKNSFIINMYGIINADLGNFEKALICFTKAIKITPNYVKAYLNLGSSLNNLGKFEDAILSYNKAIKIEPEYADAHFNLGKTFNDLGRFEDAINSYAEAIKLKPNFPDAYTNLIKILTIYKPKKSILNSCIETNEFLQNINYSYNVNKQISDEDVITFFNQCNDIITEKIGKIEIVETQIYRNNHINLNCERHFKVFDTFNVIPEFCFGCFKVQIELKNVIELFKLYFVFDNLNLKKNNSRKCMLELRKNIPGTYKGYIYCSSLNEANEIKDQISLILKEKINKNVTAIVKRGCSEYGLSYPEYKNINEKKHKLMSYKKEWKVKENIIDNELTKKNISKTKISKENLSGISISDILVMKNWLAFAKKIGDLSYKKITKKVNIPHFIENDLSNQLSKRIKEFSNYKNE